MKNTIRVFKIFISSPSDVSNERDRVEDVIQELNSIYVDRLNVYTHPIRWEKSTYPGISKNGPQSVIDKQIPNDYDVYIGIFATRFGTPTDDSLSGTEHEFQQAYERWQEAPENIEIMIYFKTGNIKINDIDAEQFSLVKNFQERIQKHAFYREYSEPDQFQSLIRIHLSKLILDKFYLRDKEDTINLETITIETLKELHPTIIKVKDDKGNLSWKWVDDSAKEFDDDEDKGLWDWIDYGVKEIEVAGEIINAIAEHTDGLGQSVRDFTIDIQSYLNNQTKSKNKLNAFAKILQTYGEKVLEETPKFSEHTLNGLNAFSKSTKLLIDFEPQNTKQIDNTLDELKNLRNSFSGAHKSLSQLRHSIAISPRLTKEYGIAKRIALEALDNFLSELLRIDSFEDEVINTMEQVQKIINSKNNQQ